MYLKRLKDLREDHDLKQSDVAVFLKIAQRTYSGYETGTRELPLQHLVDLSKYYGTSTDYILGITEICKPYE